MQEIAVAIVVALAAAMLARQAYRAIRRRCRPKDKNAQSDCGKCCKCG